MASEDSPRPSPTEHRVPGWAFEVAALGVSLLAVAVRCLPWGDVFVGGQVVLPDTDPAYHLWRAWALVQALPALPLADPFLSFPAGGVVPWPPLFDGTLALSGLAFGREGMVVFAALLMPVLGGLATWLVFRLGRRVLDPATGLIAALVFALMQGASLFSLVGRVDHHALVAPVTLGMFLCLLNAVDASGARRALWGLASAGLAVVAAGSWIVTPGLYFGVVPATLLVLRFGPAQAAARPASLLVSGAAWLLVTALILGVADVGARPFDLYLPSWFTVLPFAASAVVLGLAQLRPRFFLIGTGALVAAGVAALLLIPGFAAPFREALGVSGGQDPSYRMVVESGSMFVRQGFFTLRTAVERYTAGIFLFPVLAGLLLWRALRRERGNPGRVLIAVFAALACVLLFVQERFGEFSAPALALVLAWGLAGGARWARGLPRARGRRAMGLCGVLLLGVGVSLPLVTAWGQLLPGETPTLRSELFAFGRELASAQPPPVAADGTPRSGLLSGWDEAHPLLWLTGRGVAVSSFATPEALRGNRRAFGWLLSEDEESVASELSAQRIGLVVVSPDLDSVQGMAEVAGLKEAYVERRLLRHEGRPVLQHLPLDAFWKTLHVRLAWADGRGTQIQGEALTPLSRFRMVLESRGRHAAMGEAVAGYKAFEPVRGALLAGEARPGETVWVRLNVRTNTGRVFRYERQAQADANGRFSLGVPYATLGQSWPTRPDGSYRIKRGDSVVHLEVQEEAVVSGLVVAVPAPASAPRGLTPTETRVQSGPPDSTDPAESAGSRGRK
jgi:drug/metabolite transporter superfamily protein YnfA